MATKKKTIDVGKKINPKWKTWGIVAGIILILILWYVGSYNGLIRTDETVDEKWNNVQSAYQRRADLVPNLVSTVQGYADLEESILTQVTAARAGVGSATTPGEMQAAGEQMNSALARLLVVVEAYPDLKASQGFRDLQVQLEGTENRIKTERDLYNKAVKNYNIKVRRIPTNIVANMNGFETKEGFTADEGTDVVPVVEFN